MTVFLNFILGKEIAFLDFGSGVGDHQKNSAEKILDNMMILAGFSGPLTYRQLDNDFITIMTNSLDSPTLRNTVQVIYPSLPGRGS